MISKITLTVLFSFSFLLVGGINHDSENVVQYAFSETLYEHYEGEILNEEKFNTMLSKAENLKKADRLGEAIVLYEQLLKVDPDNTLGKKWYIENKLENIEKESDQGLIGGLKIGSPGSSEETLKSIERNLEKNPRHLDSIVAKAVALYDLRGEDEARIWIDDALKKYPNDADLLEHMERLENPDWYFGIQTPPSPWPLIVFVLISVGVLASIPLYFTIRNRRT